jgi:GxxExxY protein
LDLLVDELIIVELKAIETIHPVFEAQPLSYLQLMKLPQWLLINFFSKNIKDSVRPLVNDFFRALPDF